MPPIVLEAMAKGLLVITTLAGGTPEALGDCGYLLPATDDDNNRARAELTRQKMLKACLNLIAQTLAAG